MKKIIILLISLIMLISLYFVFKVALLYSNETDVKTFVSYESLEVNRKDYNSKLSYTKYKDMYLILPSGKYSKLDKEDSVKYETYKNSNNVNNITLFKSTLEDASQIGTFSKGFINYIYNKYDVETEYDLFLARTKYVNKEVSIFSKVNDIKEKNFFYTYDILQGNGVMYNITGDLSGIIKCIESEDNTMYEIKIIDYYMVYEIKILKSTMTIEDVQEFLSTIYFEKELNK